MKRELGYLIREGLLYGIPKVAVIFKNKMRWLFLLLPLIALLSCKPKGTIQIDSIPTGADIWLDGVNTGYLTNHILTNIPSDIHTIKLTKSGYVDWDATVAVIQNQTITISAFLTAVWCCATSSAQWSARDEHTSVVFDDKIWVLGGIGTSGYKNDVWFSTNGVDWTQATSSAGWSGRREYTSVVFDNKIWVLGGYDGQNRNDVWYSPNGVTWTQMPNAGWSNRRDLTSVVFDNKIWVLGGGTGGSYENDVWYWQ